MFSVSFIIRIQYSKIVEDFISSFLKCEITRAQEEGHICERSRHFIFCLVSLILHIHYSKIVDDFLSSFFRIRNNARLRRKNIKTKKKQIPFLHILIERRIGESLFTLFASLTYADDYLMTLIK